MIEVNNSHIAEDTSSNKKYTDILFDSIQYGEEFLSNEKKIFKVRPISIHVRRLAWNDVIRHKFVRKYRLIRPCISQISRQLLNYELKKKSLQKYNHFTQNVTVDSAKEHGNRLLQSKQESSFKNSCSVTYESEDTKMKSDSSSNSASEAMCSVEPPWKKLKPNDDENFFVGFDSDKSPTRSLIKLKTVHLKKFKGSKFLRRPSTASISEDGNNASPTSAVLSNGISSLEHLSQKNETSSEKLPTPQDPIALKLSNSNNVSTASSSVIRVKPKNALLNDLRNYNYITDITNSKNNASVEVVPQCDPLLNDYSGMNKDSWEKSSNQKTIINCIARKHTSKFKQFKSFTEPRKVSKIYVGNSSISNSNKNSLKVSDNSKEKKIFVETGNQDQVPETGLEKESIASDLSSDEENMEVDPFIYLEAKSNDAIDDKTDLSKKIKSNKREHDDFTDSDTTDDSFYASSSDLCESSEEEPEREEQSYVDVSKFISFDFQEMATDAVISNADVIYKSQHFQLKCDYQVDVCLLKASDITDRFCCKNNISGICGFKLKQLLCKITHKPQNGYDHSRPTEVVEEENEEETIEPPHFLTVMDPLTHSLFASVIRQDMREKHIPRMNLFDVIIRALSILNPPAFFKKPGTSLNVRPQKMLSQRLPTSQLQTSVPISRPLTIQSSMSFSPFSNTSPFTAVNNRIVTLISTTSTRPTFTPNLISGGNVILVPTNMAAAHGGTLIIQNPNSFGNGVASQEFIINQPSHPAPPPLTLCSDLGRSGTHGPLSISQPPQLKRMQLGIAPTIDLSVEQNPESSKEFTGWPIGSVYNRYVHVRPALCNIDVPISCPSHPLAPYQLAALLKKAEDSIRSLLAIGFHRDETNILNAAFQMIYSNNLMCCKTHAIASVNKSGILRSLQINPLICSYVFVELPLPSPPLIHDLTPLDLPDFDMFIVKRFVFAVEKTTRAVIYPLPPNCIPKDNSSIDKITVVILVSPVRGLGPGLIVFPHSVLNRNLLLSLESTTPQGNIGRDWVLSAHQKGGLTQSMLLEYLEEATPWVRQCSSSYKPSMLAVDWWWCLDRKSLNPSFQNFTPVHLHEMYKHYKDPLELCLGSTLDKIWGHLVRKFTQAVGPLTEQHFPKFIIQVLKDLCTPPRLTAWCRSSGLYPLDSHRSDNYMRNLASANYSHS